MSDIVRLMVWNLLEGGHKPGSQAPDPHSSHLRAARELVCRLNPDVLVINEALWCAPFNNQVFDYASTFGFEHSHCALYSDHWGNAILSRFPLHGSEVFNIYNRGGLTATINAPSGPFQVCTYHPHPSRFPENKAQDFTDIIDLANPDIPLVLCGDFNAISPADNPDGEGLARAFSLFSANPVADSARFIDAGKIVFPVLESLGLRDAFEGPGPGHSMPTKMLQSHPEGGMRIDHAWVRSMEVVSAIICTDPLADVSSDHYPLLVEIALK